MHDDTLGTTATTAPCNELDTAQLYARLYQVRQPYQGTIRVLAAVIRWIALHGPRMTGAIACALVAAEIGMAFERAEAQATHTPE